MDERLSHIATRWTMLFQAHQPTDAAQAAQQQLLERYCGAVYRYLLAAVHDHHAAEDLTQEFALRFVRGQFHRANPERGRFRDYVKTALFHLVDDFRSRQGRLPRSRPLEGHEVAHAPSTPESERAFAESWREELLARSWQSLAEEEQRSGQPHFTVLKLRVEHADDSSQQLAERLTTALGRPVTAGAGRQMLHRARERFAEHLLEETTRSLGDAPEGLEEELADLDLLQYCGPVLARRARQS
jgi:RNA polymerase sigma-70 factor (ECF subfamily)